VVDDGSTDKTAQIAISAGATVLRHPTNLGVGAALRTGFGFAAMQGFEAVVQCDADGQHPVRSISALIDVWRATGADLVVGSRFANGGSYTEAISPIRRGVIRGLAWYATRSCHTPITDPTSGFRILSSDLAGVVANELGDHYLADTFELIVRAARAGYIVRETQVDMRGRQGGVASARGSRLALYTTRVVLVTALHLAPSLSRPV
jgi:glycosyltransferase involved in cell wall biosynthesis